MAIFNESNPESYRSIYGSLFSEFGEELTIKIHKAYAGRQISFPKKLYTEEYISVSDSRQLRMYGTYHKTAYERNISLGTRTGYNKISSGI